MFRVPFWPPPRGGLTRFEGLWKTTLSGQDAIISMKTETPKGNLQHLLRLVFSLNENTPTLDDSPPYPFLSHPLLYCGSFKGVGTDSIAAAKFLLMIRCAEFCWETARTHGLGTENMVKHSAAAIRAMAAAKTFESPDSFPETTLPPFADPFFKAMIDSLCEFARVQKMRLPPGALIVSEIEKAMATLCYCLQVIHENQPPAAFSKWHKCFTKVLRSWLLFCVGVMLIHFKRYPFQSETTENVCATAQRINDGLNCLKMSQHTGAPAFVSDAMDLLQSGYGADIKGPSKYDEVITASEFWRRHSRGAIFQSIGTDTVDRTLIFFGATKPYF